MTRVLFLSAALFSIGLYGVIARRNLLIILMSIELLLNAVNIAFIGFALQWGNPQGHVFFLMVMAVAAAEVAVGLSIVIALFRVRRTVDTATVNRLRG